LELLLASELHHEEKRVARFNLAKKASTMLKEIETVIREHAVIAMDDGNF